MTYKIVQGNKFTLHICVSMLSVQASSQRLVDLDLNQTKDLKVYLTDMFGNDTMLEANVSGNNPNEILATFPSNLERGIYGIKICGIYKGDNFCSLDRRLFSIVGSNRECHIPLGMIDGELSGLICAKYWIDLNKGQYLSYYGALNTRSASSVSVNFLNCYNGVMGGKSFTIHTTDLNDIIWFVSPVPLTFTQSGLPLSLKMTQIDDMYYYNSDELTEGDNVITVSTV